MRRSEAARRIDKALGIAQDHGGHDEAHHKTWVIDQMVRALTGCPMEPTEFVGYTRQGISPEYKEFLRGRQGYGWDEGIPP